ncbi:MAG: hypothetical protein Q8O91_11105 [Candidatus Aminicenantes bacterium]|nr:hypothetical protein [Candidatus Aminicenantes bacterium]
MNTLTTRDLVNLVRSAFPRFETDKRLAVFVDIPRDPAKDNDPWKVRREMAVAWGAALKEGKSDIPLDEISLIAYPDTGSNNADLPALGYIIEGALPAKAEDLPSSGRPIAFADVFGSFQIILAPTEFSTTAPLKNAGRAFGFRAATMPGFAASMIPALRVDYAEVGRRCRLLKGLLDESEEARIEFRIDGRETRSMVFDLRFRAAHESGGRFPDKGMAGNLPSGETYIVPYEGEKGEPSRTRGILPVEIEGVIVSFTVEANKVAAVQGIGPAAEAERAHLLAEPAYGNMAELGFGVLGDFGLDPVGEILLDEKLGLHVAFGRSDHFGGAVGPAAFSSPAAVIHLDRIYIPAVQPRIGITSVDLRFPGGRAERIMTAGRYSIF